MDPQKLQAMKNGAISLLKEVAIAAIAVGILMGGLYAYSGVWPPMVVVESGSMQHSDTQSKVGVIDTGDMVFVKSVESHSGITAYVEGRENNLNTYGDAGNVIIYRPYGNKTKVPIIHRAVAWVEVNEDRVRNVTGGAIDYDNYSFNVPVLGVSGHGILSFTIPDYGYGGLDLTIDLRPILRYHEAMGTVPHDGFVTAGDHNIVRYHSVGGYDQQVSSICADLIAEDWVIGVAFGEVPWFGLLKLMASGGASGEVPVNSWYMLGIAIFAALAIPFCIDILTPKVKAWRLGRRGKAPGLDSPSSEPQPSNEVEGSASESVDDSTAK